MTKLFKNTKCLLSCVLAFAVIAVSLFTGVVINADAACGENVIYYNGSAGTEPTQTDADGNILITNANELRWIVKEGSSSTDPTKTYKIADGIDAIVLQPEEKINKIGGFAALKSATSAQVKEWFSNDGMIDPDGKNDDRNKWNKWFAAGANDGFRATFDGNGVTIYGMKVDTGYSALFHQVKDNATIKNVNVAKSYIKATSSAAGIVARHKGAGNTINIENCSVTDCYIESTGTAKSNGAGAILGYSDNKNGDLNINNCFVKLDDSCLVSTTGKAGSSAMRSGLAAYTNTNKGSFENCVVIGVTPYALNSNVEDNYDQNTALPSHFENVYTDKASGLVDLGGVDIGVQDFTNKIFQLTDAQMKGAAAVENMNLNWTSVWMVGAGNYPVLRVSHKNVTVVNNNDGTHSEKCTCGFAAIAENHNVVEGKCTVCDFVCPHAETELVEITPADCVNNQIANTVCKTCGKVLAENEAIAGTALGHDMKEEKGTGETCTEPGVKTYYDCSRCDYVSEDKEGKTPITDNLDEWKVIPKKGHTPATGANGTVYAWDDTTPGMHYTVCDTCGEKYDGTTCTGKYEYDDNGHEGKCTVCGIATEGKEAHSNFDDNHKCGTCGWVCPHAETKFEETTPADCTNNQIGNIVCKTCGYAVDKDKENEDTALGHDMKEEKGTGETCTEPGVKTYYDCSRCDYVSEDKEGKIPITDNLDEWKVIPKKGHTPATGANGTVYAWDDTTPGMHYTVCDTCGEKYDGTTCTGKYEYDAEGHEGKCTVCGIAIEGKEAHSNFDENHKCGTCGWVCPHAETKFEETTPADCTNNQIGNIVCKTCGYAVDKDKEKEGTALGHDMKEEKGADATCTEPGVKTYYDCSRCDYVSEDAAGKTEIADLDNWKVIPKKGHTPTEVKEVAATYEKEGTKAHWACECGKLYSDKDGENEVTAESLVIAKLVKEEKPADKPAGDDSNKSPATGENVASVAAVAALMGAAFVLVRKAKKA